MKIGVIGAGQLGRMLALAGYPLGLRFVFLDKSADAPGGQVGDIITGEFDDHDKLQQLSRVVDLITFDVENVSVSAVENAIGSCPFLPPLGALALSQDRLTEKRLFREVDIPVPDSAAVDNIDELKKAVQKIGLPAILKTRRLGYDGRGQHRLDDSTDIEHAWRELGHLSLILEKLVPFEKEISIIGVRSRSGETVFYPVAENVHEDGILHYSIAPIGRGDLQAKAESHMSRLMEHLDYAGVMTIEFFLLGGELIANEIAPRVHNSGHWTIEGSVTSQFENHIRAILGLPLGRTDSVGHSAMVNFLGQMPELTEVLAIPGAHYHSYGKAPRPKRKLGHCTVNMPDPGARDSALERLLTISLH